MKFSKTLAPILAAALMITAVNGCAVTSASAAEITNAATALTGKYSNSDTNATWTAAESTMITLGDTISIDGEGAAIDGSNITISAAGTYVLSGTLSDGQILINADADADKIRLVLNGVSLNCSDGSVIWAQSADKVTIILADGTENTISDGTAYTLAEEENAPNAAIYAKCDLSFTGTGSLTIQANYKHAIHTKDDLVITDGVYTITAASDALRGHDSVSISGGTFTITAGNDGIKSNNDADGKGWIAIDGGDFTITAAHDGVQAETLLAINAGTWNVTTGGGSANAEPHKEEMGGGFGGGHGGRMQPPTDGTMPTPPEMPTDGTMLTPPEMPTDGTMPTPPENTQTPPELPAETENTASADTQTNSSTETTETTADTTEEDTESTSAKAFKCGGDLAINGGTITVDSQDDSVHSDANVLIADGTLTLSSGDDGVHADTALVINGGTIDVVTSYEGLEGAVIEINGGSSSVVASDDGVNAASKQSTESEFSLTVNGGTLYVNASGDGLDANGSIYINGGTVTVDGPTSNGDGALDYDDTCIVTGGTLIAAGSSGMAQSISSDSTQAGFSVSYTETQTAGTEVTVTDENGNVLLTYTPSKNYQNIVITSPDLTQGKTYTVSANDTVVTNVTLSETVTNISSDGTTVNLMESGMGGRKDGMNRPNFNKSTDANANTADSNTQS